MSERPRTVLPPLLAEFADAIDTMGEGRLTDSYRGLLDWYIQMLDRPSPFLGGRSWLEEYAAGRAAVDAPGPASGCYEASFGWVHVRPGCRCPR